MPRSPSNLTLASFLKKPPDPSPPRKTGKGKKRKLSLSPTTIAYTPKKPNKCPTPLTSPQLSSGSPTTPNSLLSPVRGSKVNPAKTSPSLPYQLRSSQKRSNKKYSITSLSSSFSSRMDNNLLDLINGEEVPIDENPTSEEVDALFRDDDFPDSDKPMLEGADPDSPTAAVKSAIEAQIAENLDTLSINMHSVLVANKDNDAVVYSAPPPPAPLKKPQPLFPNGLPSNCISAGPTLAKLDKVTPAITPRGYFTEKGNAMDTNVQGGTNVPKDTQSQIPTKAKTTYATKAKSPPKPRVMVEHILFVYSTWTNKAPIDSKDWGIVDSHLIGRELVRSPSDPLIRIANSGYDATHRCGFIACRDQASAEWCQAAIRGIGGPQYGVRGAFRAWAKGEQPEARLCRLFFPSRFDSLAEDTLIVSLKKHNPPLQQGTLIPKGVDDVQGGRALYVEFDTISYSYIKSKGHKLEFVMMDIDCQIYNPPKRAAQTGPGITGIIKIARTVQTQSQPNLPTITPASLPMFNMAAALAARLDSNSTDLPHQPPNSPLKRNRSDAFPPIDGSKRKSFNK